MLDANFTTVRDALMVRLTHLRQCLTPCARPMADNRELMTVFDEWRQKPRMPPLIHPKAAPTPGKEA